MATIDLKKIWGDYNAAKTPELINIPSRKFLMIDGAGDPNVAVEYRQAIETLYPLAYGLRAAVKQATGDAYVVMPLEALWWADDMADFAAGNKSKWKWTAMIALPDAVTAYLVDTVLPVVITKKQLVAGELVRVQTFSEGPVAQVHYVGPYDEEGPTIAALHQLIAESGGTLAGKHHEIYLSDSRKTNPAKLRTVIRQPFVT